MEVELASMVSPMRVIDNKMDSSRITKYSLGLRAARTVALTIRLRCIEHAMRNVYRALLAWVTIFSKK